MDAQLTSIKPRLFSPAWLSAPDPDGIFPTNGDQFAAFELHKRLLPGATGFSRAGFVLQAIAAGWHAKSDEQLASIGAQVGRGRILVLHGTGDGMIPASPHLQNLVRGLAAGRAKAEGERDEEVRSVVWEGKGHVLLIEMTDEVARLVTEMVHKYL